MTYWLLAYGKAHPGWTKQVNWHVELWTNARRPNRWVNAKAMYSREARSMVQMAGRRQLV